MAEETGANIYKQRLLNVARALRESPNPDKFTMEAYSHLCGTPACALGHYAARNDLQETFKLEKDRLFYAANGCQLAYDYDEVVDHFGVTPVEADELFSCAGCGEAQTPIEAAEYIEAFVARKWGNQ